MTGDMVSTTGAVPNTLESVEKAPAWPPVRHPFQVSTMVAFAALAFTYYTSPTPTLEHLSSTILAAWIAILGVSGLLGIVSAALAYRAENTSLLLERAGLVGAGSFCTLYALFLLWNIWTQGSSAAPAGVVIYGVLAFACWWRLRQVQKVVKWRKRRGKALLR